MKMIVSILVAFSILFVCAIAYTSNFYHADMEAIEAYMPEYEPREHVFADGSIAYVPENAEIGIIFYPGGKVEHTAYIPLMKALSSRGIVTVLIKMPYNLAVLKEDAAEDVKEVYPYAERWFIGGHSLGGTMAASYAASNTDRFEGVILLGSYTNKSLVNKGLRVLSIYGTQDSIMNLSKYDKYRAKLPKGFDERIIEGANHSGFGMYGLQNGDTRGTLTAEEQIAKTADLIIEFTK